MGAYGNPLVGSGWSQPPQSNNVLGNPLFNTSAPQQSSNNPLMAWPGQNVNPSTPSPTVTGPSTGPWGNPGNLPNPTSNIKDITRNTGYENLLKGQFGMELAPIFANMFLQNAGPAADFFKTRMNLGDPFYQARQSSVFNQGVQENQNAAAMTNQQLAARGYGAGPSGVSAATIGGENIAGGQDLVQNFLNTLFANDAYSMQAAQGLAGVAGMFNPAPFLSNTSTPGTTQGPNTFADTFKAITSLFGSGGAKGISAGGGN